MTKVSQIRLGSAKAMPMILGLSWPIFLQMAFMNLIAIVDIYILSQISDDASAAVGAVNSVITFVTMMFSFMAQGGSLVYAQCLGAGRPLDARRYYTTAMVLQVAVGLLASLLLALLAGPVVHALGLRGQHYDYGYAYLRIIGLGMLLNAVVAALSGIMLANGQTKAAMSGSLLMNVANVTLIYLLVLAPAGPQWGVQGAAYSTVSASLLGLLFNAWLLRRLKLRFARVPSFRSLLVDIRTLVQYSVPTTLEPMLWQAAQIVTTAIIAKIGTEALAARIYTLTVTNLIGIFSASVAQGLQIIVGHLSGGADADRIRDMYRSALKMGLAISAALSVTAAAASPLVMRVFTDDAAIISAGQLLLLLCVLYLPGSSVILTTAGAMRGIGHVRYPALVGVLVLWGVFLPLAYLFALVFQWGVTGVLFAMAVDENLRATLLYRRWRSLATGSELLSRVVIRQDPASSGAT